MNQATARLLRSPRRIFGAVICMVGAVLLIVSFAGALSGSPPADPAPPETAAVAEAQETAYANTTTPDPPPATETSPKPTTQTKPTKAQTQNSTTTETQVSKPEPATITVSLTINDTFKGNVSLTEGSSQCDVLQQALADGLIGSLDMRYSSRYKTFGVYIIDGIGGNNAVWWTYKVNDKSPPVGCSSVKAHDGDSVLWEYQK